jgi:hypothetical protein
MSCHDFCHWKTSDESNEIEGSLAVQDGWHILGLCIVSLDINGKISTEFCMLRCIAAMNDWFFLILDGTRLDLLFYI